MPFLPPISQDIIDDGILVYTLVLDLDETLIHFDEDDPEGAFYVRPGAVTFLQELSFFFEIVVFTAAMPDVSFMLFRDVLCFLYLVRRQNSG